MSQIRGALAFLALFGLLGGGCAARGPMDWGSGLDDQALAPPPSDLSVAASRAVLVSLSEIFYDRITARRFDSLATFEDPALREFFRSDEAFADYYAAFADALVRSSFESNRPTAARLESMEWVFAGGVEVSVRFRGENAKPLRWWSAELVRADRWEFIEGRWWIIPGKV